jgi:hypothetical protein
MFHFIPLPNTGSIHTVILLHYEFILFLAYLRAINLKQASYAVQENEGTCVTKLPHFHMVSHEYIMSFNKHLFSRWNYLNTFKIKLSQQITSVVYKRSILASSLFTIP